MAQTHDKAFEAGVHRHQAPRLVIIGGGFTGVAAARALRGSRHGRWRGWTTHQPVEQLISLRAIPGMVVLTTRLERAVRELRA
jgi:NADH dehydrogenase FAD-containing subunit